MIGYDIVGVGFGGQLVAMKTNSLVRSLAVYQIKAEPFYANLN